MEMPTLGLGTFRNTDPKQCAESVQTALDLGYRHIDTAARYENEVAVGKGIASADVRRDDVFLATKVLHPRLTDAADKTVVKDAAYACLERLGVETVDLLYIHWPDDYDHEAVFTAFSELEAEGAIEHVGVSNYTIELLEDVRNRDPPVVANQVEMHPLLQQTELREYSDLYDITIVAYAPLMRGEVADVEELQAIAAVHDATPYQVSLAWIQAKGAVPIPKATGERHIRENWAAQHLELTDDDIKRIDSIDREKRCVDPSIAPAW